MARYQQHRGPDLRLLRLLCPLVPLALLDACGSCTSMISSDEVTFTFEGGDWPPGVWEVEVSGYTMDALCVVTLPWVEGDLVSCGRNAVLTFDDAGGIATFTAVDFHPESFGLWLVRDGEEVFQGHFAPDYDLSKPNGEHCPGHRYQAALTVPVPAA